MQCGAATVIGIPLSNKLLKFNCYEESGEMFKTKQIFASAKANSPVTPISDADEVLSRVLAMAEPT